MFRNAPHAVAMAVVLSCAATMAGGTVAATLDASCKLRYPIVLSHHFSVKELCPPDAPKTGAASCMAILDYDRYCAVKTTDAQGQPACTTWRVPADEESLPPRNTNAYDASLHRDVTAYRRYFSKEIVSRLRDTCGNAVYIADKPAYASYEVRARSLRNTVNEALARENAPKVVLVGLSQGVQDARYMTAKLPVSDTNPALGMMSSKVAALVSLSGEDGGAESASLGLAAFLLLNGGHWEDYQKASALVGEQPIDDAAWKRDSANGGFAYVMGEQCRGAECDMDTEARYKSSLNALFNLGTDYMRPSAYQLSAGPTAQWRKLADYLGVDKLRWADVIPPALEANNGVAYFSYGGQIRNWSPAWGGVFSQQFLFFASISLTDGFNDGYVSVKRQRFANPAPNFQHIKTLEGAWWGRGYNHMFFAGMDKLFTPAANEREAAPYDGDAASFYQQMARDLKARGF
ncbi:MAG: hypothetical protein QM749_08000 [Aquabacterium sp.]